MLHRVSRKTLILFLGLLVLLAGLFSVRVVEGSDPAPELISVEPTRAQDLFMAGETIIIDEDVAGDLYVAGQSVLVTGHIEGNAFIAARTVTIDSRIDGSLYTSAGDVMLDNGAHVERNLLTSAFSVTTQPESWIGRNVYIGAYQALLNGDVDRNVMVGVAALEVTGRIGGDLDGEVTVDPSSTFPSAGLPFDTAAVESGLRISSDAIIGGDFNVTERIVNIESETPVTAWYATTLIQNRLGELLALLLITALFIYFTLPLMQRMSDELATKPAKSALWGTLLLLLAPLVAILTIILLFVLAGLAGGISLGRLAPTVLGLGGSIIGLIIAAFAFAVQLLSKVVVALFTGQWLMTRTRIGSRDNRWTLLGFAAIAILFFEVLRLIPLVGGILTLIVMIFGVGAIARDLWNWYRGDEEPEPIPTAVPKPAVA